MADATMQYIESPDSKSWAAKANTVWSLRPQALYPSLDKGRKDPNEAVRLAVVGFISRLPNPGWMVAWLIETLDSDPSSQVREVALSALKSYREEPYDAKKPMRPDLLAALTKTLLHGASVQVRLDAAEGLIVAGAQAIEPLGTALVSDPDPAVRKEAAYHLGWIHVHGLAKVPPSVLQKALHDPYSGIRRAVASALWNIDPKAEGAKKYSGMEGSFEYKGPQPYTQEVDYTGDSVFSPGTRKHEVYQGWLEVWSNGRTEYEDIKKAVEENGGKLLTYSTRLRVCWVAVEPGMEAEFIKALGKYSFIGKVNLTEAKERRRPPDERAAEEAKRNWKPKDSDIKQYVPPNADEAFLSTDTAVVNLGLDGSALAVPDGWVLSAPYNLTRMGLQVAHAFGTGEPGKEPIHAEIAFLPRKGEPKEFAEAMRKQYIKTKELASKVQSKKLKNGLTMYYVTSEQVEPPEHYFDGFFRDRDRIYFMEAVACGTVTKGEFEKAIPSLLYVAGHWKRP